MKNIFLVLILVAHLVFLSCNATENERIKEIEKISKVDTCKSGELYSYLFLDFRDNMTIKQFVEKWNELIKKGKIDKDSTIKIFIPNDFGNPIEVKFFVTCGVEEKGDCYIHRIYLNSHFDDILNSEPKSGVLDLYKSKYGKPDKLGFINLLCDDGEVIDGFLGLEFALSNLKTGQKVTKYQKIENSNEQGSSVWNTKDLVITVRYDKYRIYIEYRSLKYIHDKEIQEMKNRAKKDSLNNSEINNSKKSI